MSNQIVCRLHYYLVLCWTRYAKTVFLRVFCGIHRTKCFGIQALTHPKSKKCRVDDTVLVGHFNLIQSPRETMAGVAQHKSKSFHNSKTAYIGWLRNIEHCYKYSSKAKHARPSFSTDSECGHHRNKCTHREPLPQQYLALLY